LIAFLVPTAAMAKSSACKDDKAKFCKDVKASGAEVNNCLKQHAAEVTAACKEALDKAKEAKLAMLTCPLHRASPGAAETKP
jgi:hypothetical protein